MERATEAVVSAIRAQSMPVTRELTAQVAKTAAGGNQKIADSVVQAYAKVGRDGVIVIEQSNLEETALELQEGMSFDRGYIDAALVSPTEVQECVLEQPYILTYDRKISSMKDLLPLLELVAETKRSLLIVADDVEGEALATIVLNRKNGILDCLAVKAPGYGDRRKALLEDIAVVTASTPITLSSGRTLVGVTLEDLGSAGKAIVTKEETTILDGAGESNISKHAEIIRQEISRKRDPFEIEKLRERLAKLRGAIAAIRIGGISPQDMIDDTYCAESAMHSVRTAIEEGCWSVEG
jgi:chaperonin GroEL